MAFLATVLGVFFILVVLVDAFETIILPRTVMRRMRLSNLFFEVSGKLYLRIGRMKPGNRRQMLLVAFAPLNLLILIVLWALLLILGWGLVHWSLAIKFDGHPVGLLGNVYFSGVTFLTLGYGDLAPTETLGRVLAVVEAGMGFVYLALVIGYVPVLYNAFSRREVQMLLLDSKAGSDPMGVELLRRYAEFGCLVDLTEFLKEWERFGAELLEGYLSYPLLAYYRSQHDNQSWLRSLTAILDACALIEVGFEGDPDWARTLRFQARSTFAMARHVIVDLSYILDVAPIDGELVRMPPNGLERIRATMLDVGVHLKTGETADRHLEEVRQMYEPYIRGLAHELVLELPHWCDPNPHVDNWQTSAWEGVRHF